MIIAETAQSWAEPRTLVPLIVSIVALLGVIITNFVTTMNAKKAEDRRAQATIDAEDRRAQAALDAEDRRHANTTQQSDHGWLRGAKAKAYFGVVQATTDLVEAAAQIIWFARPLDERSESDDEVKYQATNPDKILEEIEALNNAHIACERYAAEVRAVGNPEIAQLASRVRRLAGDHATRAMTSTLEEDAHVSYNQAKLTRRLRDETDQPYGKMMTLIRADLGAEPAIVLVETETQTDPV